MKSTHPILKGTLYLTVTGLISRIIGFFYRIFLSHTIGAEGMGIFQLISPVYVLCFALTVSGIHTGISRFTSAKLAGRNSESPLKVLYAGLLLSVLPSIVLSWLVYENAAWLSLSCLKEARCADLLRITALSIPFGAVHSCINAYYYGIKKTGVPAFSQLIEQIVRVGGAYLVYLVMSEKGMPLTPSIAAVGMVLGEIASVLFTITAFVIQTPSPFSLKAIGSIPGAYFASILTLSLPLTGNKLAITLLQSIEAVMIPARLKMHGLSTSEALSIYGILTGMVLPLILFPSAVTNSLSVMLLPDVAEAQASDNFARIARTAETTIKYCLLLGILCTGIFLGFGRDMGTILFGSPMAGHFIVTMGWICPFLYLSTTLGSILHGLGKTGVTFLYNLIALGLRIGFIVLCVPLFGIQGYLWGLLAAQLVITLLSIYSLNHYVPLNLPLYTWVVKPLGALCIAICCGIYTGSLLKKLALPYEILSVCISCLAVCAVYFVLLYLLKLFPKPQKGFL